MWPRLPEHTLGRNADLPYDIDGRVLIEIADHQFTIGLLEFDAIEPEFAIFGVGVPGAGFGLAKADHSSLDGVEEVARQAGVLVGDLDALTGEDVLNGGHGGGV